MHFYFVPSHYFFLLQKAPFGFRSASKSFLLPPLASAKLYTGAKKYFILLSFLLGMLSYWQNVS
jgi:hypothetical protein